MTRKKTQPSVSFNPRARDGRERADIARIAALFVSIHAPVMDANDARTDSPITTHEFQSTRP